MLDFASFSWVPVVPFFLRTSIDIIVFERSPHTSYSACGIPYYVGDVVHEMDALIARAPQVFREKYNIDARTLHEVTEIDLRQRRVRGQQVDRGHAWWEPFDQLLIATGAVPVRPDVRGGGFLCKSFTHL